MTPLESAQAAFIEAKISLGGHDRFDHQGTLWCLSQRPAGANVCWLINADRSSLVPVIETVLDSARLRKSGMDFLISPSSQPADLASTLRKEWRMMGPMYLQGMTRSVSDLEPSSEPLPDVAVYWHTRWDSDFVEHPLSWWVPKAQKPDWWLLHQQMGEAFGLQVIVAEIQGRPASCAVLFCHHGMGLISSVVTLAEHRSRGLGGAVLQECMGRAKAAGCHSVGLLGHKRSLDFYRRLGFENEAAYPTLYYSKTKAENQPLFNSSPL